MSNLSIKQIFALRSEAFSAIRFHNSTVLSLATGIEAVDVALQTQLAVRGIDEQAALLAAGRRLASLLESGVS